MDSCIVFLGIGSVGGLRAKCLSSVGEITIQHFLGNITAERDGYYGVETVIFRTMLRHVRTRGGPFLCTEISADSRKEGLNRSEHVTTCGVDVLRKVVEVQSDVVYRTMQFQLGLEPRCAIHVGDPLVGIM